MGCNEQLSWGPPPRRPDHGGPIKFKPHVAFHWTVCIIFHLPHHRNVAFHWTIPCASYHSLCMADQARQALTASILGKWRAQRTFIRFMDGNKRNTAANNLVFVSLPDCLANIDAWVADWDMELTAPEVDLVRDPQWRAGLNFRQR